jgi:prepilin-type N-terminal cleavage/methylation domain-containing protein
MVIRRRWLPRVARAGFTLIELLAVITIIAILAAALVPQIPKFIDRANVTACRSNLQDLYRSFVIYKDRFKDWPEESGIRFFLKLWKVESDNHNDTFAKKFTCPGVAKSLLPGLVNAGDPREWYENWDAIDSTCTAYAGRDRSKFPSLDKNSGNQALVADDNELADTADPGSATPNHLYTTLVLMADGSVKEYDIEKLREEGVLEKNQYLIPGPDCPVPELRTLSREAIDTGKKKR